jgi:hypothetical protein
VRRPKNWKNLSNQELTRLARKLLNWGCNQEQTNAQHEAFFKREVKPIHDLMDKRWTKFWKEEGP